MENGLVADFIKRRHSQHNIWILKYQKPGKSEIKFEN